MIPTPSTTGDTAMPLETVHVAFCDCTGTVHTIGAFPTLAAAHAARREKCGDDGGFVADTTYRTDGPTSGPDHAASIAAATGEADR